MWLTTHCTCSGHHRPGASAGVSLSWTKRWQLEHFVDWRARQSSNQIDPNGSKWNYIIILYNGSKWNYIIILYNCIFIIRIIREVRKIQEHVRSWHQSTELPRKSSTKQNSTAHPNPYSQKGTMVLGRVARDSWVKCLVSALQSSPSRLFMILHAACQLQSLWLWCRWQAMQAMPARPWPQSVEDWIQDIPRLYIYQD